MELDHLKSNWKVLDENLDKTKIVTNQQIRNIIMEKIETTLDKVKKQSKMNLIASAVILLPISGIMFTRGNALQGALFLLVIVPLLIASMLNIKELKELDINKLSPSEFLLKLNSYKVKFQQTLILVIPIVAFIVYILSMNNFFTLYNWIGFAIGIGFGFPFMLIKQYKVYKNLHANLQELKELKEGKE